MYAKKSPGSRKVFFKTKRPPYQSTATTAQMPKISETGEARSLRLFALFLILNNSLFWTVNLLSCFFSALNAFIILIPLRVSSIVDKMAPNFS